MSSSPSYTTQDNFRQKIVYDQVEGPFRVITTWDLTTLQDELNEKFQKNWKLVSITSTADSGSDACHHVVWDTRGPA
jgi:hypothetical protein